MKILINRKPVIGPWGGGNKFVEAFWKYGFQCGVDVTAQFDSDTDVILMIGSESYPDVGIGINEALVFKSMHPNVKLVYRMNDHNLAKESRNAFDGTKIKFSQYADGSIFVSRWLEEYYQERGWLCSNNVVIYNGVDQSSFKRNENKLSNQNGKINIVAHHWGVNEFKGFDIYEKLEEFCEIYNDRFTFTYIGRHPGRFKYCRVIDPIFGDEMGKELSQYDLYVSASKCESGPNHVLEALACEIPVLITDLSGGGLEFVNHENYFSGWDSLKSKLLTGDYVNNLEYNPNTMKDCVEDYVAYMKGLV